MRVEEGYLGYLKYEGEDLEEGVMDARDSASALLGFDEAYRYFIEQENPAWGKAELNLPVRIQKGCWQIMIPLGGTLFASYYLKTLAEQAAKEGLFNTGPAKDLDVVLRAAFDSLKWIIKISKHVKAVGDTDKIKGSKLLDMDHVVVLNDEQESLTVPQKYVELYANCSSAILGGCAKIIREGRSFEIGSIEKDRVVEPVCIYPEERIIFFKDEDELDTVLFPELEHGMKVELDGEITRVTESTNTLGFRYEGHVLLCRPYGDRRIASFKHKIISQQKEHFFPAVRMWGVVDRTDRKHGGFKVNRPCIVFDDIRRTEEVTGYLFE